MNTFENIPAELRQPALWLQYYLSPDPKKPDKKPRKHPEVKYATPEDRTGNLRSLDYLIQNRRLQKGGGYQRYVQLGEGFAYIDLDHVRDPQTGEVQPWALEVIEFLNTYTEISASGAGFHLVARGRLLEDFKIEANPVEIYSGHIPNKLMALTGDVYELYVSIETRQVQLEQILKRAQGGEFGRGKSQPPDDADSKKVKAPSHWRDVFHLGSELDSTPGKVFIKGILEEGITFFGAHSGVGKTWIGLSISHALLSGQPLFGHFPVLHRAPVLYLVPEMGGNKFRERMVKMKISMDGGFFCQTIRDGACNLDDPMLLQAIADMRPVVILDTAIRFQAGDEQSSSQQAQGLGAKLFALIRAGAQAVICMHHRKKDLSEQTPTLENTLRGTGDFGAMADCVWCAEYPSGKGDSSYLEESKQLTRIALTCVKPRDMEPADPFTIQGRPHINDKGDFAVVDTQTETEPDSAPKKSDNKVLEILKTTPDVGMREIMRRTGYGHDRVERIVAENNYKKVDGQWQRQADALELGIG